MDDKGVPTTYGLPFDQVANMWMDPETKPAAEAEMRVLEYRAILGQAEAAERQAKAAERSAEATVRYVRYTFWLLVSTTIAALAAVIAAIWTVWMAAPR